MAGGIFTNRPFQPNPKCIVYSFIVIALYYYTATRVHSFNNFMIIPIFIVSYVSLAYYDFLYNCDTIMKTGDSIISPGTLDAVFKPNEGNDDNLLDDQEKAYKSKTYLFHLLAVMPLLLYVGYNGPETNEKVYPVVLSAGVMAGAYHGFKYFSL